MRLLRLTLAIAVLNLPAGAARADARMELPAQARQGELVVGRVPPGSQVSLGERRLRVAPEGWFAFGLGRDSGPELALSVRFPDGSEHRAVLPVNAREWRIERVDGLPPSTVNPDPVLARRIAREQALVAAARERDDARTDFLQRFQWPVRGRISGVYGSQRILNGEARSPHYGLDVAVPNGTPLRAPASGVVILAEPAFYLTGGTLTVDHGHGVSSTFIHLSRIDVAMGDRIDQGQVIGAVGATGRATGPHMHWGMNWFDVRLDPQLLLPPP